MGRSRCTGLTIGGMSLAIALAVAATATVQRTLEARQQRDAEQPTFRTGARLVRADVFVTRDGRPVTDLRPEDFRLLEDGVPQKLEKVEFVNVPPAGPSDTRLEPNSVGESRQMAADPYRRVFVVFLDTNHVQVDSSQRIRVPLVRMLDRLIGHEDLVAILTPQMAGSDITLARRTESIDKMLEKYWTWGRRYRAEYDVEEERIFSCQGTLPSERPGTSGRDEVARRLLDKYREQRTLEVLEEAVAHLNGIREERKAILVVSEGWRLERPDRQLAETRRPISPPQGAPVFVDPEGKIRSGADPRTSYVTNEQCEQDRIDIALADNYQRFLDLIEEANRANASFYPVDPRGLAATDTPIDRALPPAVDHARLRRRIEMLRTLADNTDGIAVVEGQEIETGLRRVAEDLNAYYLLSYYSSNTKADGKFREIEVEVARPGVSIRARRGYRAPTEEELSTAVAREAAAESAAADPSAREVELALGELATVRREARLMLRAYALPAGDGAGVIRVVSEVAPSAVQSAAWAQGGRAEVTISADGETIATGQAVMAPGHRSASVDVPVPREASGGTFNVRVRVTPEVKSSEAASDAITTNVPDAAAIIGEPVLFRRVPGPLGFQPTADPRFRRSDRMRWETVLGGEDVEVSAKLLDRRGEPMAIPLGAAKATAVDGRPIASGDVLLAPLAPGDYVIEISASRPGQAATRRLTAFRIVP